MRYSLEHKARNREKILAMASRSIREHGGDTSGIGTVMKKAGLTKGGFYRHFASKDDLFVNEKVILACKMPVEAPFCQACLFHHRADAARVPAVLPDRAGSHGENLLPVPRFVFQRISHAIRVLSYSIVCQDQN